MRTVLRRGVALGASLLAVASPGADAQMSAAAEGGSSRTLSIVPTLSVNEILTDNSRLSSSNKRSELVTTVQPGIRMESIGGRVRGFVDYSLSGVAYARDSSKSELQNALNANLKVEAIENWIFVDASGNISQQLISPLGTRSTDSSLINNNQTEVRTFSLSPYIHGQLGTLADYEGRYAQTWTRNNTNEDANNTTSLVSLRLNGNSGLRYVSWSVDASHQVYDYSSGSRTQDDRVRGVLYIGFGPELRFSLIQGRESNNIISEQKQSHSTTGFGVDWQPSERTRVSAQSEQRFFGHSHAVSLEYRTPRSIWRYSDTNDISTGFGQPNGSRRGTAYDLYFAQLASQQPDPVLRAALVDEYLRARGILPTQVSDGSLTAGITRQRRQELSFALVGIRDSVTLTASRSQGRRIGSAVSGSVPDDFANDVTQRGVSATLAHRLTASAALNLVGSIDRISGVTTSPSTSLRSFTLFWSDQLGMRSSVSLGARRSEFSSPSAPYTENALTASLGVRF